MSVATFLHLGKGQHDSRSRLTQDRALAAYIGRNLITTYRGVERDRHRAGDERPEERLEIGLLRPQHQGHRIPHSHTERLQPGGDGVRACQKLTVGDRLLGSVFEAQMDMRSVGCSLGVPAQRLDQSACGGRRRSRNSRRHRLRWRRDHLGRRGCRALNRSRQISRCHRVGHHAVGESDPKRAFYPEQQLDALQAADAQVTVENIVEPGRWPGAATELSHEAADHVE
jgi:hypothetical protein